MKTEMVRARVTAEEKAAYEETAGREPLSSWVRRTLNAAVTEPVEREVKLIDLPSARAREPLPPAVEVTSTGEPDPLGVRDGDPAPEPVRRCEQWRNHRAGRFCKTCGETMPV